jgi:hypothetical protein
MSKRMDFNDVAKMYEVMVETVEKVMFEDNFDKHGWTKEEFLKNASFETANEIADYEAFVKPLISAGHILLN